MIEKSSNNYSFAKPLLKSATSVEELITSLSEATLRAKLIES